MNLFLPKPYDDELIRSVYLRHCAGKLHNRERAKFLYLDLKNGSERAFLPFRLHEIAQRSWATLTHSTEALLFDHTLLPYFLRYAPEYISRQLYENVEADLKDLVPILRFLRGVQFPRCYRWCPDCAAEDRREFDETFWHRRHQLMGVPICDKHRLMLVCPDGDDELHSLTTPAEWLVPQNVSGYRRPIDLSALDCDLAYRLLDIFESPACEKVDESFGFHQMAALTGYSKGAGQSARAFEQDFREFWLSNSNQMNELWFISKLGWSSIRNTKSHVGCVRIMRDPLSRTMLEMYFQDRYGVSSEVAYRHACKPFLKMREKPIFYCPNPFAPHDSATIARSIRKVPWDGKEEQQYKVMCDCGMSVTVRLSANGRKISMKDVTKVNIFGDGWKAEVVRLRESGMLFREIGDILGINNFSATVLYHSAKKKVKVFRRSIERRQKRLREKNDTGTDD